MREEEQTVNCVLCATVFPQALNRARQELRFLLVYLHSPGHQDTPLFCRYSHVSSSTNPNPSFMTLFLLPPSHFLLLPSPSIASPSTASPSTASPSTASPSPPFLRSVLSSEEFIRFTSAELLIWAVGVNTEEGVRVSYVLRENTYPFLALIVLKQSRMVVCERVEGEVMRVGELVTRLTQAIRDNEGELVVERNER